MKTSIPKLRSVRWHEPDKYREAPNAGNVVYLGNLTRKNLPSDRVLHQALGRLTDVVILGYDKEGGLHFASSMADGGDVLWLMSVGKRALVDTAFGE